MSTEILEQQVQGLEASLKEAREKHRLLTKASGLDEQAEKAAQEAQEKTRQAQDLKAEIKDLQDQKAKAVGASSKALAEKMKEVLPYGEPVLDVEGGRILLSWQKNGSTTHHSGLSGGERVAFDAALAHALSEGVGVLILEAAELDNENLAALLEKMGSVESQIIINTAHQPEGSIPDGWSVINLGEGG